MALEIISETLCHAEIKVFNHFPPALIGLFVSFNAELHVQCWNLKHKPKWTVLTSNIWIEKGIYFRNFLKKSASVCEIFRMYGTAIKQFANLTMHFWRKFKVSISCSTGAKAIGTAWTIAPSEEEESIWGGKALTKGNCTLFNKLTIVKLSMTMRVFIMHVFK